MTAFFILGAIPPPLPGAQFAFDIPPVPILRTIGGQSVRIVLSGTVRAAIGTSLGLDIHADLADFQSRLTPVLQGELNKSDRCGERISVENAMLAPAEPAGRLTVQLHIEKWACFKVFGKENAKRLVGGNARVEARLRPAVENGSALRLDGEIADVQADGSLGEMLRAGPLGTVLRDKIRESMQKAIRKAGEFDAAIPEQARPFVSLQSAAFSDGGNGRLVLSTTARLQIPAEQLFSVLEQFRHQ